MATVTVSSNKNIQDCIAPVWWAVQSGSVTASYALLNPITAGFSNASRMPSTAAWNAVCYGNKVMVAIAGGPSTVAAYHTLYDFGAAFITTRPDGTTIALPASKEWKALAYGGKRFVAISDGTVDTAYTTDGVYWTAGGSMPGTDAWKAIAYGGGRFVAVSGGTSTAAAWSDDGGETWNSSTLPSGDWRTICYGNGLFVALSYNSDDVAVSDDGGETWDAYALPSTGNWSSVCYGNGKFVAVGYNSTKALSSTDGVNWSDRTLQNSLNWTIVFWGDLATTAGKTGTSAFIALATGTTTMNYSYDGVTWVTSTYGGSGTWNSACYVPFGNADTLVINEGATVTQDTVVEEDVSRDFQHVTINNGLLRIENSSTSEMMRFGMLKAGEGSYAKNGTVYGLGSVEIEGNWIEIGEGDGSADQHFHFPTTDYCVAVWIETEQVAVTITSANPGVVSWTAHGLYDGAAVIFYTAGTLPTGITAGTVYYVVDSDDNSFSISATIDGAAIDTSGGSPSGTFYACTMTPWMNVTGQVNNCYFSGPTADNLEYALDAQGGMFFKQGIAAEPYASTSQLRDQTTDVLTFGDGVHGKKVPDGAKVRVPNIIVTDISKIHAITYQGNSGTSWDARFDLTYSGRLSAKICQFYKFLIVGTTARELECVFVGLSSRPTISKCNELNLRSFAFGDTMCFVVYYGAIRCIFDQRWPGSAYQWTYLNNVYIRDFHKVNIYKADHYVGNVYSSFYWQYCNGLDIDGFYIYQLWQVAPGVLLTLDYVNNSNINNLRLFGAGYVVQNSSSLNINGVEHLAHFDGIQEMFVTGVDTAPVYIPWDKAGNLWEDDVPAYFRLGLQPDSNYLYPMYDTGQVIKITPFTPSDTSFPYITYLYVGTTGIQVMALFAADYIPNSNWGGFNSYNTEIYKDTTAALKNSTVTITIANPAVVTWANHGFVKGQMVTFTTVGSLAVNAVPTGITGGTTYYARPDDCSDPTNEFWLYDTYARAVAGGTTGRITTTLAGSGTINCVSGSRLYNSYGQSGANNLYINDTSVVTGTPYWYMVRHWKDVDTPVDGPSMEITPQLAVLLINNYCLQSDDFSSSSWTKTNIATVTTNVKKMSNYGSTTGDRMLANGGAGVYSTCVQAVSGLLAGTAYTFAIMLSTDDTVADFKISLASSGVSTVEQTFQLYNYSTLCVVTITTEAAAGSKTITITLGSSNSWANGTVIYAGMAQLDTGSTTKGYVETTSAKVENRQLFRLAVAGWNWKTRTVVLGLVGLSYGVYPTAQGWYLCHHTSSSFSPELSKAIGVSYNYTPYYHYFQNNVNSTFINWEHSLLENNVAVRTYAALIYTANCNNCKFVNWEWENCAYLPERIAYIDLGSKDLLFHNWYVPEMAEPCNYWSATGGIPFWSVNSCSGITLQNCRLGTNYLLGSYVPSKNTIFKGVSGGHGSSGLYPGMIKDSPIKDYVAVFDTFFFEQYAGDTDGLMSFRFNNTEKGESSPIQYSGSCGFDSTGKFYIWGLDAVLTMTVPYTLLATTGFRNIEPKYYLYNAWLYNWTIAQVAIKPPFLKVEYSINSGDYKDLTATNLSAEDCSDGFTFTIKISVAGYDLEYLSLVSDFVVGETIVQDTSGATAKVEEVYKLGTSGHIRISNITGTFINAGILRSGGTARATAYVTTTYSSGLLPNAGVYIAGIDIYTTVDQDIMYPIQIADLNFTGLQDDTEIRVYRASDGVELGGIEDCGATGEWSMEYEWPGADVTVNIAILALGFIAQWQEGIVLGQNGYTMVVQQQRDRQYLNPA